jgi:hypothetical protein
VKLDADNANALPLLIRSAPLVGQASGASITLDWEQVDLFVEIVGKITRPKNKNDAPYDKGNHK